MAPSLTSNTPDNSIAYLNGHIYTVNPAAPWAEAFIVGPDGRFSAIGSSSDISPQAKQQNLITHDLRGRFIMPGIHDAHVHLLMSALGKTSHAQLSEPMVKMSDLAKELRQGSCACKYAHAHQDWLIGHTYMIEDFDRAELDREFPDTPVLIRGGAGHSAWANSEALRRTGYDVEKETPTQGAWYGKDAKTGKLTGEVAETAMDAVMSRMPQPGLAHVKRVLKAGQQMLHKAGVTSCQEASANTLMLHGLKELEAEGDLKLDVQTHIVYAPQFIGEETSESLHKLLDEAEKYKSAHVDTRFVKIILDGVPLAPYFTQAGILDDGKVDESKLFILNVQEAIKQYDARGMTVKIHCTGHGSTRLTLDAIAAVREANPNGPRHEIAHCSGVHDDDYRRYKELNVTAEMSPAFFFVHPVTQASEGLMDWNFTKMRQADAHMTIGSDWGAGADPDLLPCVANIVESLGDGDRAKGGERVLRLLTLAGAEAVGREKEVGSIEVGKKANFIAVDRDLAKGEFEGARVLETWFEGESVCENA